MVLFRLESCNDEYLFFAYNRNDLPTLVEALESMPFIYTTLINAICKNWNVDRGSCGAKIDLDTRSYSIQSAFPERGQMPNTLLVPSEAITMNNTCSEKRWDEKAGNDGLKMENHLASSEGSAEVSQTSTKTDNLMERAPECTKRCSDTLNCCHIPEKFVLAGDHDMTSTSVNVEVGKNLRPKSYSHKLNSINSKVEVHPATNYVNCYEFARTASLFYEEFTRKTSDKSSTDAPRSAEDILAGQLKIVLNRFVQFSWSNIQNLNTVSRKERCGWCLYCRVPEYERDCLFSMNDSIPDVEKFSHEVLGIQPEKNAKNHLIDVMCHIICIEDHLQGLLTGPWLNPDYSMLWHANLRGATDIASLKFFLLQVFIWPF